MAASQQFPYASIVADAARRYNLDPRLIYAILHTESGLGANPRASMPHDPDSPIGIAQMRPSTMRGLGFTGSPTDPVQSIYAAAAYLDQGMKIAEANGVANPGAFAAAYYNGPQRAMTGGIAGNAGYVQLVASKLGLANDNVRSAGATPATAAPAAPGPATGGMTTVPPQQAARLGWGVPQTPYDRAVLASGQLPTPIAMSAGGATPSAATTPPAAAAAAPGRLPETWAQTGAPISNQYMPPSLWRAPNPAEQALWQQASTPAGYAALAGAAAAGPAGVVTRVPATAPSMAAPAGGSRSWAGVPGPTGSPSGPAAPPPSVAAPPSGVRAGQQSDVAPARTNTKYPMPPTDADGHIHLTPQGGYADTQGNPVDAQGRYLDTGTTPPTAATTPPIAATTPPMAATTPPIAATTPPPAFAGAGSAAVNPLEAAMADALAPPAGGSRSWAVPAYQGAPGSPAGPAPVRVGALVPAAGSPLSQAGVGEFDVGNFPTWPGYAVGTPASNPLGSVRQQPAAPRNVTDEEIGRLGPDDVFGMVSRDDLTQADRAALQYRLMALSPQ